MPTILFLVGMSKPICNARSLGVIGLLSFYQEFYGTCIYFLSFIVNGRYKTLTVSEVLIFVCFTNGTCRRATNMRRQWHLPARTATLNPLTLNAATDYETEPLLSTPFDRTRHHNPYPRPLVFPPAAWDVRVVAFCRDEQLRLHFVRAHSAGPTGTEIRGTTRGGRSRRGDERGRGPVAVRDVSGRRARRAADAVREPRAVWWGSLERRAPCHTARGWRWQLTVVFGK